MNFSSAGQVLLNAWQKLKQLGRNRAVRWSVNLVVLVFCAAYLLEHFPGMVADLRGVRLNGWWIAAAWLLTFCVHGFGAFCWVLLLRGLGQQVDWLDGVRAHLNSSVVRYIPGYVWQFVGKAYLTSEMGVPLRVTNVLMAWELALLLGCGTAVALIFAPQALVEEWGLPAWAHPALVGLGCALYGAILAAPWAARKVLSRTLLNGFRLHARFFLLSAWIIAVNWVLNGISLWLTALAFGAAGAGAIPFHVFTFSSSLVAGILVIPVPNGLGVREGMMVYLLSHLMPQSLALLIAAVSRLEMVTGEFAALLFAGLLKRIRLLRQRKTAPGA